MGSSTRRSCCAAAPRWTPGQATRSTWPRPPVPPSTSRTSCSPCRPTPAGRRRKPLVLAAAAFEERGHPVVLVLGAEQQRLGGDVEGRRGGAVAAQGELGEVECAPGLAGGLPRGGAGGGLRFFRQLVNEPGGAGVGRRQARAGVEHAAGDLLAGGLGEAPVGARA